MLEAGDHVGLEVIPPEAELLLVIHFQAGKCALRSGNTGISQIRQADRHA
jgi:hypothetical protein